MDMELLDEMASGIERWLRLHDYNYIECNDVPANLFVRSRKINVLIRTFFRLCPFNLRRMKLETGQHYPITPHTNVTLLRAYSIENNILVLKKLYERVLSLRSPKVDNFALRHF